MSLKLSSMRMFGAAMLFVVLCAASSVAHAHPGHAAHASPAIATPAYSVEMDILSDVDAPDVQGADVQAADVQNHGMARSELRPAHAAPRPNLGCAGVMCCGNAPCAACDFTILHDASLFLPAWTSAAPFGRTRVAGDGIRPHDLLRPPRSFG